MVNKKYLLDTNILVEFIRGNRKVTDHILKAGLDQCCISIISMYELYFGAYNGFRKSGRKDFFEQEMTRIHKLQSGFAILPLPAEANNYGSIKAALLEKGRPVDEFDIIIGTHALTEGLTIVTDNLKHFNRIPGLDIENWMR